MTTNEVTSDSSRELADYLFHILSTEQADFMHCRYTKITIPDMPPGKRLVFTAQIIDDVDDFAAAEQSVQHALDAANAADAGRAAWLDSFDGGANGEPLPNGLRVFR